MIKVAPGTEITEKLVTKIIEKFKLSYLPRFKHLENYYLVENKIRSRQMDSSKPNNKLSHGFAKYISNMATSFFMGEGIRMDIEDEEYKDNLTELLLRSNIDDTNFEISKEMSKCGIAFELLYMNEKAEICFKKFKAEDIIPVYSSSVSEFLEFAIRIWSDCDLLTGKTVEYAEVYTKSKIIKFKKDSKWNKYKSDGEALHNFQDVPIIVYWNNEERKSDYEDIISLIDAYDKSQSDTANDFEYFTDAYLVLNGASGFTKEGGADEDEQNAIQTLKNERVMLLDENGQASWLIKNINDTAVENFKNRIYENIFFLSQVPALSDESFAGNLSGVAIRYKLIGLEQLATMKENKFLPAYKKKLRLITKQLNTKLNRVYDAHSIEVIFDRNMTDNLKELAEVAYTLTGIASRETLLSMLPFVDDVQEEMEKIRAEKVQEGDYDNLGNIDVSTNE
ncbi:MAG: phage portal protein [Bacillales bacterium]|nr:phage portal protein [Bacillales bacterium]